MNIFLVEMFILGWAYTYICSRGDIQMKRTEKPYVLAMVLLLLSNILFPSIASASMVGGGSYNRTIYGLNYDQKMGLYTAANSSTYTFDVYTTGKEYYKLVNTYPGTSKKTVKDSIYTVIVPDSVDFSSLSDFSLIGETNRVFTGQSSEWLNGDYSGYLMDPSLYSLSSDEEARTITVTIPNTSEWTSINSTCLQFSYTAPSSEEGNLTWKAVVYSSGQTLEASDTMQLYNDVVVHYVDNEGNPIDEDTIITDKFGTTYYVGEEDSIPTGKLGAAYDATSYIKDIEGYTYDHVQGASSVIITSDIQELTFVYNKEVVAGGDVTVKYIDEEGNPISDVPNQVITGNIGDNYDATTPDYQISIPGYHLDQTNLPENITGQFTDSPQEVVYIYIKDKTVVNVHDSTLYVGEDWTAEDNFDSALDKDGNSVEFKDITVKGDVDTSKADQYTVTYSYDGVESPAVITIKDKQTAVNVHDSTLYVGEDWTAEDNFDSALDKDGNSVEFKDITVKGDVDNSKADQYTVTYSYDGVESPAVITVKDKQTAVNVHDSTLYVGEDWTAEDNFDSALDKDGNSVEFKDITVKGDVDTSKADQYTVTYSYDGVESQVVITVKDKENDLAHIVVHDSTLKVGDEWNPEDNFDEATDFQGNIEDFSKIIIEGSVDTTKAGIYEVTYKIPEEHWDRALVEGYHSATAKIKVTEESMNNSEGDDNDDELDSSSDSNTNNTVSNVVNSGKNKTENNLTLADDKNDGVLEQNLPQTGENAMSSFFILVMGIASIIGGLIMFLLLLKSRKRKIE